MLILTYETFLLQWPVAKKILDSRCLAPWHGQPLAASLYLDSVVSRSLCFLGI